MLTVDYMAHLQKTLADPETGAPASVYAVAKAIGVTKQSASDYALGRTNFSERVSLRVAEILGVPPGLILLDMALANAHSDEARASWKAARAAFCEPSKTMPVLKITPASLLVSRMKKPARVAKPTKPVSVQTQVALSI